MHNIIFFSLFLFLKKEVNGADLLCRINKFDMFTMGQHIVLIKGNGKWMDGSKNMETGIPVFF
jgi:hypothetical protein